MHQKHPPAKVAVAVLLASAAWTLPPHAITSSRNPSCRTLRIKAIFFLRDVLHIGDVHHLDLGEAEQPPRTVLHADSRPLGAAERQIRRDRQMLIHPRRSALELRRH